MDTHIPPTLPHLSVPTPRLWDTPLCLPLPMAHLSAGAHWGKGIGAAQEHLPAGNNQDSHIVLTLLLRWEGKERGPQLWMCGSGRVYFMLLHHRGQRMPYNTTALDPCCSEVQLGSVGNPHSRQVSQGLPTSDQKLPAEPLLPWACTSVFPLLWQERRVSSLEAHSVACGRNGDK